MRKELVKISKKMSLALRHHPEKFGLELDEHGWADLEKLMDALAVDRDTVETIVRENDKKRFALSEDGKKIRARQGHSIAVDVEMEERVPPEILYHGTGEKYADYIDRQGLLPKGRLYVHLSPDTETAEKVGQRHGKPVLYEVKSGEMHRQGYTFLRSENGVWQTAEVPARFLVRLS